MESLRIDRLRAALAAAFPHASLEVVDDSHKHAGHVGVAGAGGETHYHVTVSDPSFARLSRVERHRAVQAAVQGEFAQGLHALQISTSVPEA